MLTFATLSDPAETAETETTINQMIEASEELAANIAQSRDKWSSVDVDLARLIEGLRIQFEAFAAAARANRVTDLVLLRSIGRAYEHVAMCLYELGVEADGPRAARECVAKAAQLTGFVSDMLERGSN